jgi:hypothetical protein
MSTVPDDHDDASALDSGLAELVAVDPDDPHRESTASVSLFEGDEGGLEYAERRALVTLLKQRFISARTHPRDWRALAGNERVIRSRLNDLFLELQIDPVREVAWKRQAVSETGQRFPTLLHDSAWSREETVVLVHLRDRFRAAAAAGEERVFVDREDVVEHVAGFRPPHATDVAGDEKRARNAVASVNKAGLLIGSPTDDRFEISEAIESLLPVELLNELVAALKQTKESPATAVADGLFEGYEPEQSAEAGQDEEERA